MLAGGGPADVRELTVALAREMLALAGLPDADPAAALDDGRAMDVWRRMIAAQGGDPDATLPEARERTVVTAESDGVLVEQDAKAVGVAAWRLGAGRARQGDPVQHGAGVLLHAKPGDRVTAGQPLATLLTDEPDRFPRAESMLRGRPPHRTGRHRGARASARRRPHRRLRERTGAAPSAPGSLRTVSGASPWLLWNDVDAARLPKVSLHDHLDGGAAPRDDRRASPVRPASSCPRPIPRRSRPGSTSTPTPAPSSTT